MRRLILRVPDGLTKLGPQLRILNRYRMVHRRVAGNIRGIVRQRTQGEGVLIGVLAVLQHLEDEVSTADVVHQIAKFHASKRVVAQILDYGAAIGVGVGFLDLLFRQPRVFLEQEGANLIDPEQIDNFLVRENGVGKQLVA